MDYKQKVTLAAQWDGREAEQGFSRLSQWADTFTANLAAKLSSAAIQQGVALLNKGLETVADNFKKGITEAANWETRQMRIETAMRGMGTSWQLHAAAIDKTRESIGKLGGNTSEFLGVFDKLLLGTGDVTTALENMQLVWDVSAASGMQLEEAARKVAVGLQGQGGALAELIPFMRKFSAEQHLSGESMRELSKFLSGQAAGAVNIYAGSWANLKGSFADARGELMEGTLPGLTELFNDLNKSISAWSKSDDAKEASRLMGDIATNISKAAKELLGGGAGKPLAQAFNDLLREFRDYTGEGGTFKDDLKAIAETIGIIATSILEVSRAIVAFKTATKDFYKDAPMGYSQPSSSEMSDAQKLYRGIPLANGGFLNYPDMGRDTIPAMLRGGEYVIPPEMIDQMGGMNMVHMLESIRKRTNPGGNPPGGFANGGSTSSWVGDFYQRFGSIPALSWLVPLMESGAGNPAALIAHLETSRAQRANRSMTGGGIQSLAAIDWVLGRARQALAGQGGIAEATARIRSAQWDAVGGRMAELSAMPRRGVASPADTRGYLSGDPAMDVFSPYAIPQYLNPYTNSMIGAGTYDGIDYSFLQRTPHPEAAASKRMFPPMTEKDFFTIPFSKFQIPGSMLPPEKMSRFAPGLERSRYSNYSMIDEFQHLMSLYRNMIFGGRSGYANGGMVGGSGGYSGGASSGGWYLIRVGNAQANAGKRIVEALERDGIDLYEMAEKSETAYRKR
jgi:hypothetical protein